jgi:uncharacterized Zn-binding protein involved in type VI secretion
MAGAGRLGDKAQGASDAHGCPGCPHPVVGPAISGSSNVNINSRPALRVDDTGIHAACCGANMWQAAEGSATVFINGKPAVRQNDPTRHCGGQGKLIEGSDNVFIGGASSSAGGGVGSSAGGAAQGGSAGSAAAGSGGAGQQAAQSQAHSDAAGTHAKGPIKLPALTIEGKRPATDSTSTDAAKDAKATGTDDKKKTCNKVELLHLTFSETNTTTPVWHVVGESPLFYRCGLMIDADGSPHAYHPDDRSGLDHLGNAQKNWKKRKKQRQEGKPVEPIRWCGAVTDDGTDHGEPIIQGPNDPAPGFYVSPSALQDHQYARTDPKRYVDAENIPYVSIPPDLESRGVQLGDFATVGYNGQYVSAIVADIGPHHKIGEGSVALAKAIGVPHNARGGGIGHGVTWILYPGSGNGQPRTLDKIEQEASRLFDDWGGADRVRCCLG